MLSGRHSLRMQKQVHDVQPTKQIECLAADSANDKVKVTTCKRQHFLPAHSFGQVRIIIGRGNAKKRRAKYWWIDSRFRRISITIHELNRRWCPTTLLFANEFILSMVKGAPLRDGILAVSSIYCLHLFQSRISFIASHRFDRYRLCVTLLFLPTSAPCFRICVCGRRGE